jgi:hypothetical protein
MDRKELPVEGIEGDDGLMRDLTGSVLTEETPVGSSSGTPKVPLQRYEALHKYAKECLDEERSRYDWTEAKTARYLTILTIVLGVNAIKMPEVAVVGTGGGLQWGFLIVYAIGFGTGVGALLAALKALRFEDVPGHAIEEKLDIGKLFTENSTEVLLRGFADRYLEGTRALRATNDRRARWAHKAYRLMAVSIIASFAAVVLYIGVKAQGTP